MVYVVQTDNQTIVSDSPIQGSKPQSEGWDIDEFAFIEAEPSLKTAHPNIPNAECANPYKRKPVGKPDSSQPIRDARLPSTSPYRANPQQPQTRNNGNWTHQ
jgi:hypothetical protein